MFDVPVDEADDTTDACTTLAVCDNGMSEKISKSKMKESSNKHIHWPTPAQKKSNVAASPVSPTAEYQVRLRTRILVTRHVSIIRVVNIMITTDQMQYLYSYGKIPKLCSVYVTLGS